MPDTALTPWLLSSDTLLSFNDNSTAVRWWVGRVV